MDIAKPVSTPLCASTPLNLQGGSALDNPIEYRTLVGSLQYLALTRPDVSFSVTKLSQFMHQPTYDHWSAAKRVLRYLAGTANKGIFLRRDNKLNLHAFSDADWARNKDDYTSTSAHIVFLGQHPVSWSSKKLKGVARSSTKVEYRSVATTA
ncbi:Retrovirus-related Pol polyprotein from transposon RE2 [Cardamine amara subsp. amara]|uniref:Retrovirus-related Pol polyprotein from transposon RE2 n=1 Tax=Cardamine amara subsp. amara TaxID=228776 RepID=A0ABD0ZU69_CARAN